MKADIDKTYHVDRSRLFELLRDVESALPHDNAVFVELEGIILRGSSSHKGGAVVEPFARIVVGSQIGRDDDNLYLQTYKKTDDEYWRFRRCNINFTEVAKKYLV